MSVVHPTESVSRGQNFVTTDGHDAARRREAKTPRDKSACYDGDDDDYYYEQQTVRTTRPLLSWPALLSLGAISLSLARAVSLSRGWTKQDSSVFVRFLPLYLARLVVVDDTLKTIEWRQNGATLGRSARQLIGEDGRSDNGGGVNQKGGSARLIKAFGGEREAIR